MEANAPFEVNRSATATSGLRHLGRPVFTRAAESDECTTIGEGSAIYYTDSGSTYPPSIVSQTNGKVFAMEEQKQQLFGICEIVQSKIGGVLDQIARMIAFVSMENPSTGGIFKARELLSEYERSIWPTIIDVDAQVRLLAQTVRQTIDSCNINEARLIWLLAISNFQVKMEKMLDKLINEVNPDLERVLNLRVRCEIHGLKFKANIIEAVQEMQRDIASH